MCLLTIATIMHIICMQLCLASLLMTYAALNVKNYVIIHTYIAMSVAVVLPAGSYRLRDTEVALPQQLLLLLPAPDTFNSVVKSFSAVSLSLPISLPRSSCCHHH